MIENNGYFKPWRQGGLTGKSHLIFNSVKNTLKVAGNQEVLPQWCMVLNINDINVNIRDCISSCIQSRVTLAFLAETARTTEQISQRDAVNHVILHHKTVATC